MAQHFGEHSALGEDTKVPVTPDPGNLTYDSEPLSLLPLPHASQCVLSSTDSILP